MYFTISVSSFINYYKSYISRQSEVQHRYERFKNKFKLFSGYYHFIPRLHLYHFMFDQLKFIHATLNKSYLSGKIYYS